MSHVLMVTKIGDQELHVGKCTHAQARIITKKKHGEIRNGKLFLALRPIHLQAGLAQLEASPSDPNVSKAELERRKVWLQELIGGVIQAELQTVREPWFWQKRVQAGGSRGTRKKPSVATPEMDAELIEIFSEPINPAGEVWSEGPTLEDILMPDMHPLRYQAIFGGPLPGEGRNGSYESQGHMGPVSSLPDTGSGTFDQSHTTRVSFKERLAEQEKYVKVIYDFYGPTPQEQVDKALQDPDGSVVSSSG